MCWSAKTIPSNQPVNSHTTISSLTPSPPPPRDVFSGNLNSTYIVVAIEIESLRIRVEGDHC